MGSAGTVPCTGCAWLTRDLASRGGAKDPFGWPSSSRSSWAISVGEPRPNCFLMAIIPCGKLPWMSVSRALRTSDLSIVAVLPMFNTV
jgi:hypothetical protein